MLFSPFPLPSPLPKNKYIKSLKEKKEREKSQINTLNLQLQEVEEHQSKPEASRRKEIIKIKAELNGIETKETIQRMNPGDGYLKR